MQGYLQIWNGIFSQWCKYYFRIHQDTLVYGPKEEQIQGRVHLKIAQIISKLDDPISLMIHTGTSTIYLKAYSIEDKVRWFKRLKEVQKQIIDLSHNKELFKMKVELSKINRFKILDDLNTQLWKCHAELQQRLQQVILKIKNVLVNKGMDKLRMTIDEFKYKTSQILQYIDEEIRDLKVKQQAQKRLPTIENEMYFQKDEFQRNNQTNFYSFYQDMPQKKNRVQRKLEKIQQDSQVKSFSSLSIDLKQKKSIFEGSSSRMPISRYSSKREKTQQRNNIKKNLLRDNKVYQNNPDIISRYQTRNSLPATFTPEQKFPFFGAVADALTSGDLTRLAVPVTSNEPLTTLQKKCEEMYYAQLLDKANQSSHQNLRMLNVASFVVSTYSVNEHRIKIPFNPLLGETFEYVDDARGYQYLAQQVSLDPPITALHVKSSNFQLFDTIKSTISFSGNSIKALPQAKMIIKLQKNNDYYVISKCVTSFSGIVFGKTQVQMFGQVLIKCKDFDTQLRLQFQQDSVWKGTKATRIKGVLKSNGVQVYTLQGAWNKQLIAYKIQTKQKLVLWKKTHRVISQYYNYNQMALQLNHLNVYNNKSLPPTDSRFRPDQRALELRQVQLAVEENNRLQQKQKRRKKQNQRNQVEHQILWFKKSQMQGQNIYLSNQKYWDQKVKGSWRDCPDIY